jgi:hypothetical protein
LEGFDTPVGLAGGRQLLESYHIRPHAVGVQLNLTARGYQYLGIRQSAAQVGQLDGEFSAGGGIRTVRPEEEAELLSKYGLQPGGQSVEHRTRQTAADDQGLVGPGHLRGGSR